MQQPELIPGLFRTEFSKITTVLTRYLGVGQLDVAEDIASETFLVALETWPYQGLPEHPVAWLHRVAINKAKNYLHRQKLFHNKVVHHVGNADEIDIQIDWSDEIILDSQLMMMFTICHPSIPVESQIGLALRILCGFGIDEIANAFLTNKETINKRLFRAREKIRTEKIALAFPSKAEMQNRLEAVLTTLYLLFNEGYYSESNEKVLREELCVEAMRLTAMLMENEATNHPPVHALFALMCFHASRFQARKQNDTTFTFYEQQDESLWDQQLIGKGVYHLHTSANGNTLSRFHLEASIAYWHTIKEDTTEKWVNILHLYELLLQIVDTPIVALNRIYALAKVKGSHKAVEAANQLQLPDNPYYYTLLGTLYKDTDRTMSMEYFKKAMQLAHTKSDRDAIARHMAGMDL
jgi:RNA polymerase sigma-70 factor (ECF subfamily)